MLENLESNSLQPDAPETLPESPDGNDNNVDQRRLTRLSQEIKEITALYNIGVAVGSSLNLREVLYTLYKDSSRLIDTSNFAIVVYDEHNEILSFALVVDQGKKLKPFFIKQSRSQGLVGRVLATRAPVLVRDTAKTNTLFEVSRPAAERPIGSWLGIPILNPAAPSQSAQGVICIWSYEANAFSDHHLWLLSAIGTQAAIAIRNARLFESSQRRATEMAFLNDVARTLSATLELDKVLVRIMEEVDELLQVEAGSLLLTDPANGDLVFQIALGDKGQEVKPFRIPRGQGIAGEVALSGKPLLITNVDKDERHFKEVDLKSNFITRSILCVPLILYDQVMGVLQVLNKKTGNFTQHDLELLNSIASYAAIAIENARLHENVLAERDRVIAAEEQARRQLARDLHDGPTQLVANIMMKVDFCRKALQKSPSLLPDELDAIQKLAERASRQMRTMLFELRPLVLETQGLGAALQVFLDRRQQDVKGTRLRLEVSSQQPGEDIPRQDDKVEAAIFAIVQETVNNALKHAQAKNIVVKLNETGKAIHTIIVDDGVGFEVNTVMNNYEKRGSLGMVNIYERAQLIGGEVKVTSAPSEGTTITVIVPKEKEERMKKRGTGPLSLPGNKA